MEWRPAAAFLGSAAAVPATIISAEDDWDRCL